MEQTINGRALHPSLPRGESACALRLAGHSLMARLPSGEVLKLDLRQADFQRGGADGSEFVYASRNPVGPTFITSDADLHGATMVAALDSAEELAAVLAHEMNHVLARHSMEMTIRTSGLRFLVHVASGGKLAAGVAMSVWSAIGVMGYSRDKEREADRQAVHLLVSASIDPQALLPMFGKLQAEEERHGAAPVEPSTQKMLEKFRSHPASAQRIADVEAEIANSPPASPQTLDVDFAALVAAARVERETTRPRL